MSQNIMRQTKAAKQIKKPRPLKLTKEDRQSPVEGISTHNTNIRLSTNDLLGEYKCTVYIGFQAIQMFANNSELLKEAKMVMEEHFNPQKAVQVYGKR